MMRILVTGSRTWTDPWPVRAALTDAAVLAVVRRERLTVVHGGAGRGADAIAASWCAERARDGLPVDVERHPADWWKLGRRAGPVRNRAMVDLGADVCLAFIRDRSAGASHCAQLAEQAGIETHVWRWPEATA